MCAFTGDSGAVRQAEFFVYRAGRPPDAGGGARAPPRRRAGGADHLDPRQPPATPSWCAASACARPGCSPRPATTTPSTSSGRAGGARPRAPTSTRCAPCSTPASARACTWRTPPGRREEFVLPFVEAVAGGRAPGYGPALRPKFRVCDTMGLGLPLRRRRRAALRAALDPPRCAQLGRRRRGPRVPPAQRHPPGGRQLPRRRSRRAAPWSTARCSARASAPATPRSRPSLLHVIGMGCCASRCPTSRALNDLAALYAELGEPLAAELPALRPRRPPHPRRHPRRRPEQVLVDVRAVRRAPPARPAAGGRA